MAADSITAPGSDRAVSSTHESALIAQALAELAYARTKWPGREHLVLALVEESGTAVRAALDYRNAVAAEAGPVTRHGYQHELARRLSSTIAVALRVYAEGDPTLSLPPLGAALEASS